MSSSPSIPVIPIPAATILLLRDGLEGLEVLMMERHRDSGFAAGAMVFPGGKIDPSDQQLMGHCSLVGVNDLPLARIAAIREAFEETSILLARRAGAARLMTAEDIQDFRDQQALVGNFPGAVAAAGISLATDLLIPIAHWITPAGLPKRFDTRFFVAPAPPEQIAREDGFEAIDAHWTTPRAALDAADQGSRFLMLPTYLILRELSRAASVAMALDAAREREIVTVIPEMTPTTEGYPIRVPPDVGYDLENVPWDQFRAQ